MTTAAFDPSKFEQLQGKVLGDIGGAIGLFMAYIGDQTGIYRALEHRGSCSHSELAKITGVNERYLREWLSANAAFGYVDYNGEDDTFSLSPEQAALFSHEGDPSCLQGIFQTVISQIATQDTAIDVFKSGKGRPWGEHHSCCFCGTDRFLRPLYTASLIDQWIPALNGVEDKLKAGAKIGDIGCGHGSSSLLLASSYPNSEVHGFDFHAPSIAAAKEKADRAQLANVHFQVSTGQGFSQTGFDLICIFDALHDMGDPVGVARHIREALKPDGVFMVVEPLAADSLADNLNLFAGISYGMSTTICVPASRAQDVGLGLGAQAGEARLTAVLKDAGFTKIRRAAETPVNMVLEAIP
ncbi:MAG: class I SAM-dependent methyltransferase [Porticoccaceae bacterium]